MSSPDKKILNFTLSFCILLFAFYIVAGTAKAPKNEFSSIPEVKQVPTTTLLAVGDIMLSRNVSTKLEQANDPNLPFTEINSILKSADITFGNLECPLSDSQIRIRQGLIFRCLIQDFAGVINSGFDVLSTANNHSFDQGRGEIDFTIDYLQAQGILPVGIFKQNSTTSTANVVKRNGTRFGFLGYSYSARNDGRFTTDPQVATMDVETLKSNILNLKSFVDVIIVSMHAGTEYTRHPNQKQIDFAHAAIDAGADLVLGHHPHWIQDIEVYNGKPIFYSLGNFVFDQMWSQDTREGLMVQFEFHGKDLKSVELMPIIIDNYCCPRLADDVESQKILKKIDLDSNVINF